MILFSRVLASLKDEIIQVRNAIGNAEQQIQKKQSMLRKPAFPKEVAELKQKIEVS